MEKPLEMAWVGQKVVWARVSGDHQNRMNCVSQVNEDSDGVPTCWLCVEELRRGTVTSVNTSVWGKSSSSFFAPKPDNSVSPCMSKGPFDLLPQC